MSQTVCKFVSLLTACALLFVCVTGCGENENPAEKKYRLLFEKGIVIDNNIGIHNLNDTTAENRNVEYLQIEGLHDKTVEDKINRRLHEVMEEMRDSDFIPPYRGIALQMKRYQQQYGEMVRKHNIYFYQNFNSNHILTVDASCYVYYFDQYDSCIFGFSYAVPLNFDLMTGNELTLKDFFAPGTDYIETVNQCVDKCLMSGGYDGNQEEYGEYSHITSVSPFTTVTPEQKFIINSSGGITLYIDYDTPEFYTDDYFTFFSLPAEMLGSAYMPYIVSEKPLFESEQRICRFLEGYNDRTTDRDAEEKSSQWQSHYFGHVKYGSNTPEKIIRQAEALTYDSDKMPLNKKQLKKQVIKTLGNKKKINLTRMVSTVEFPLKTRDYYGFTRNYNVVAAIDDVSAQDDSIFQEYSVIYNTSYCFDSKGDPISPYSFFRNPEEAEALLEKAIPENIRRIARENGASVELTDEIALQLVRKLIPHINGAAPNATGLSISYDISWQDLTEIIRKTLNEPDPDDSFAMGLCGAEYSDIGCENLVCFKDAFA